MTDFAKIADLEIEVDGYELERRELAFGEFLRVTTTIHLRGGGEEGLGEDVVYTPELQDEFQAAGPVHAETLAGRRTLGELCEMIGGLALFSGPPEFEAYERYRRWAFESAALDLALRQAGIPLYEVLGREPRPVTYVVSLGLGRPPTMEPIRRRLALDQGLKFKVDATSAWTEEIFEELRETGTVNSVDLKGLYTNTPVDQPPDPVLYRRVVEYFPDAWIEDPGLTPETEPILLPHRDRITWDANIHERADIDALPFPPRMVNVKPSRIGSLEELFATYAYCEERGIRMYSGGQSELGIGRGQIQYLSSLYHPDEPNDVAPGAYNREDPPPGLPSSPMPPVPSPTGFLWGE